MHRPASSNDPNARLVPLRPSWQPQQQHLQGSSQGSAAAPRNAWQQQPQQQHQQRQGYYHQSQGSEHSGDFFSDQDTFSAGLQALQQRQGGGGGSGGGASGWGSVDLDFEDVMREQAAFAAEIEAAQAGGASGGGKDIRWTQWTQR